MTLGLLFQCAPPVHVVQFHSDANYDPAILRDKTIGIVVTDRGSVKGFPKAFRKVYGTQPEFAQALSLRIKIIHQLMSMGDIVELELEPSERSIIFEQFNRYRTDWAPRPEVMQGPLTDKLKQAGVEYLVVISRWEITDSWRYHNHTHVAPGGVGAPMTTTTSSKVCHVVVEGGLIDLNGRTWMFGEANGDAEVFFFNFKSTLRTAIEEASIRLFDFVYERMDPKYIGQ